MNRNIKRYPAVWKIRHRTGNIDDHPQRYHINVGKRYGNFRQISPHYRERRFNNPPVRSNWSYFAEKWNMGVADLDDFARYMGYRDFDEMESRISPWELYNKSKVKFKYALRKTSDKGYQYFKEQPREVIEHEIEETASVSGWLDNKSSGVYRAEDIAKKLNLQIVPKRQYKTVRVYLKRYVDPKTKKVVKAEIIVPKGFDLSTPEMQHSIWHEIGHYLDDAKTIGGRGQLSSFLNIGKYSSPNSKLLKRYKDFIKKDLKSPDIVIVVDGKKFNNLNDLMSDSTIPDYIKADVKLKYIKRKIDIEEYLDQNIELFANGFAKFMLKPDTVKKEAPELYNLFQRVAKDYGIKNEEVIKK